MVTLDVVVDGTREASGPAFDPATVLHVMENITLIGMPNGTSEGRASVIIRAKLPDGRDVFIETTLRLLATAVDALRARYGS